MANVADLGAKVKAKYPGHYDDLPNAVLGTKIKAKYPGQYDDFQDASGPAPQPDQQGSSVGRFLDASVGDTVRGAANAVMHPVDTAANLLQSHMQQAQQTKDSFQKGDYMSAVGHGLATALPVIGPAAAQAGEEIGSGNVAGGLGHAAALLAPFGMKAASPAIGAAREGVADAIRPKYAGLDELANQNTKGGKARLARYGPDIQKAGIGGTAADMKSLAQSKISELGPQIGAEKASLDQAGVTPDLTPVHKTIDDLIAKHSVNGVSINEPVVSKLQQIKQVISDAGKTNALKYGDLDKIRQTLDEGIDFNRDGKSVSRVSKAAVGAIRDTLANTQGADAINALKHQFYLYKGIGELADMAGPSKPGLMARVAGRVGGHVIGGTIGDVVGGPIGGIAGYAAGGEVGAGLVRAISSGAIRRASASFRNVMADAIAKGNFDAANKLAEIANKAAPVSNSLRLQEQQ